VNRRHPLRTHQTVPHSPTTMPRGTPTPPWLFPFDRARHEAARATLGPDSAAVFARSATTASMVEHATREFDRACADGDRATRPTAFEALERLSDVEDRHLVLVGPDRGSEGLALAQLAVAHRRQLAHRMPARHRPLLGLALVVLTHHLHATGRLGDAVATGQEAVDLITRLLGADDGVDARPALVLALDASVMTCLANERRIDGLEDLLRATDVLEDLTREDAGFGEDLHDHLRALADLMAGMGLDADVRTVLHDVVPRGDPSAAPRAGRTAFGERTAADELYEDGVHLATSDGDGPAAAAAIGSAVGEFRRLLGQHPAEQWSLTLRRLSRALWRHAVVLSELLGRPRDAMGPGRDALARARQVLRTTDTPDEFDAMVGELGITLHDLCHIALDADLIAEHDQLAAELDRLDRVSVGRHAMHALGTALHNRAAEACETTVALAARDRDMTATILGGVRASTRAIAVRGDLAEDGDELAQWELANSLLAHGHLLCLRGDGQHGAQAMADAYHTVLAVEGGAAEAMRGAAEAALLAACAVHPNIIPRSDWPL
jgi:hypothetical protein